MGFIAFKTQLQRKLVNWITRKNDHVYTHRHAIPKEAWKKEKHMKGYSENNTVGMQ